MKRNLEWCLTVLFWSAAIGYCVTVWRGVWCLAAHWGRP